MSNIFFVMSLLAAVVAAAIWYFGGAVGQAIVVGGIVYLVVSFELSWVQMEAKRMADKAHSGQDA